MTDAEAKRFYDSTVWRRKRAEVMELDHHECVMCKSHGRYTPAKTVHHVKHLKDRPDLALEIWDGTERQLISLCLACHDLVHPEKRRREGPKVPITEEFW